MNLEVSLNGWIGNVQMAGKLSKLVEISILDILKILGVFSEEQCSVLSNQIRILSKGLSEYPLLR